jgi:hypothetical protein
MCYSIYLSTTSPEALDKAPSSLFHFYRVTENDDPEIVSLLDYPERWFLECQYGSCSCHFRHLMAENDLGFGPSVDWFAEDADDVEAMIAVYNVFKRILARGHQLDLVDSWNSTPPEDIITQEVSLNDVPADHFRFFERHKFILRL